jgi:hypothetical protein
MMEGMDCEKVVVRSESQNSVVAILREAKSLGVFRSALEENFSQPNSIAEESLV